MHLYWHTHIENTFISQKSATITSFVQLSIHGIQKAPTWSRLATSALAGDRTITLQPVYPNWEVGDEIVIAPSGWDPMESEIRTIVEYNRRNGMTFC